MRIPTAVGIIVREPDLLSMLSLCVLLCLFHAPHAQGVSPTLNEISGPVYRMEFFTSKANRGNGTLLELSGEILPVSLRFKASDSGYQAFYELSVVLFNRQDDFVASASHKDTLRASSLSEIVELEPSYIALGFLLPPERYKVVVLIEDLQSPNFSRYTKTILIPDYSRDLMLSDLLLSHSITRTEDNSEGKNGWIIQPNPSRHFGTDAGAVYVYSEVYNLSFGVSEMEKGVLSTYSIWNMDGAALSSFEIPNIKVGRQSVLVAMIPIQALQSGRYKLVLRVRDLETGCEVDGSAHFFVDRSGLLAERL